MEELIYEHSECNIGNVSQAVHLFYRKMNTMKWGGLLSSF